MTDEAPMSTEPESTEDEGGINLILRQGGEEIILRQVALGYQPMVLIEPNLETGSITVDATEISPTDLSEMFALLADLIRDQLGLAPEEPTTTEENN